VAARRSLFPATGGGVARRAVLAAAVALALAAAFRFLDLGASPLASRRALGAAGDFARGLWPPDLSVAVLRELAPRAIETLAVSVLGTALAAALGVALAYAAARPLARVPGGARGGLGRPGAASRAGATARAALALLARAVMNLGRTLPELLWALALVLAVGLGPFAGALALGIHTAGVLGRLYFEALEEVPPAPLAALRDAGASPAGVALHGLWPQVFPQLVAYTLYRWEVNIRASAVLGVVGAGGLGRDLKLALSWFDYPRAATLVLAILALVLLVDLASALARRRVLRGPPEAAARDRAAGEKALAA
jgi:phosphonate transport system permease protein